jgi:DNA-binding Xre family transcriptional regulator
LIKLLIGFIQSSKRTTMQNTSKKSYPIAINELIIFEMNRQGITANDLARQLNLNLNTVYHFLKKPSIQIDRLWAVCEILQINFFRMLAEEINIATPVDERINKLEVENEMLKEVITLLGGNK